MNELGVNKILLVDDETIVHSTIKRIFRLTDIKIEHASNAHEALHRLGEGFKVVIVDVRMPGMDGLELLQHIKGIDPTIKVILLSGYRFIDMDLQGQQYGAFSCLTKSISGRELIDVVKRALDEGNHLPHPQTTNTEMHSCMY